MTSCNHMCSTHATVPRSIFQQDNDRPFTARVSQDCLRRQVLRTYRPCHSELQLSDEEDYRDGTPLSRLQREELVAVKYPKHRLATTEIDRGHCACVSAKPVGVGS
ncbi:hypothetical protein TNCV_901691 [Trichonephila clavipes]|nr:hypothetical protein TNCV_901691 [Trichonephila clavipes]